MADQTAGSVPRIRFKGFDAAWEPKKLGQLYTERNERGEDSLPILSVSIHSGISNGELSTETLGKKVRRSEDKSLYKRVQSGDLVLNMMRAWQGALGVAKTEGMVSPAYLTATPDDTVYPLFMDCGLRRPQTVAQMNNLSYGVTDFRKRLYWDSFVHVEFDMPSVSEQQRIASFFFHLDSAISLHQHKHFQLVALKKAMLQKMFPKPGAASPEVRFDGFRGNWEKKRLGELMPITSAARVHKHEWTTSGVPFFRTSDVVSRYNGEQNAKAFISLELFRELSKKVGRIKQGDILLTGGGSIGIPYLVTSDSPLYFKDADLLWLKVPESIDGKYLYSYFCSEVFSKYLESISHIGTIGHYTIEQAKGTHIDIPTIDEQRKVGAYFYGLDALISRHAVQIQKLQQIKSALLEEMFA
jgi:type I restriction enzyme, S subunit